MLKITITTQNGTPPIKSDREQRHDLWLAFCNALETELGPCTPTNVHVYQERLEAYEAQINFPLKITRNWPVSKNSFKNLTQELGSDVLAIELTPAGLIGVVYVG